MLSVPFDALIAYPLTGVALPEYPLPPVYTKVPRFCALAQISPTVHKANNNKQIFARQKEAGSGENLGRTADLSFLNDTYTVVRQVRLNTSSSFLGDRGIIPSRSNQNSQDLRRGFLRTIKDSTTWKTTNKRVCSATTSRRSILPRQRPCCAMWQR